MIRPTVILTQPTQIDYPLFRWNMRRFREYFDSVMIAFFKGAEEPDYSTFYQQTLGDIATFVRTPQASGDWRNNTVNDLLRSVKTEYVLFLEQDFLVRDQRLWEVVLNGIMDFNTILYTEDFRIHPAFALVPTELVNQTSKDFSANPQAGYDHFGKFFRELQPLATSGDVTDLGLEPRVDFYHMAGLSNNYQNAIEGKPFYKPFEFLAYNHYTRKLPIAQPPAFQEVSAYIEKEWGRGDSLSFLEHFFPKEARG